MYYFQSKDLKTYGKISVEKPYVILKKCYTRKQGTEGHRHDSYFGIAKMYSTETETNKIIDKFKQEFNELTSLNKEDIGASKHSILSDNFPFFENLLEFSKDITKHETFINKQGAISELLFSDYDAVMMRNISADKKQITLDSGICGYPEGANNQYGDWEFELTENGYEVGDEIQENAPDIPNLKKIFGNLPQEYLTFLKSSAYRDLLDYEYHSPIGYAKNTKLIVDFDTSMLFGLSMNFDKDKKFIPISPLGSNPFNMGEEPFIVAINKEDTKIWLVSETQQLSTLLSFKEWFESLKESDEC